MENNYNFLEKIIKSVLFTKLESNNILYQLTKKMRISSVGDTTLHTQFIL